PVNAREFGPGHCAPAVAGARCHPSTRKQIEASPDGSGKAAPNPRLSRSESCAIGCAADDSVFGPGWKVFSPNIQGAKPGANCAGDKTCDRSRPERDVRGRIWLSQGAGRHCWVKPVVG